MGDTIPRPAWTQGSTTREGPTPQSTGQNKSRINSTGLPHPSSTPPPRGTTVPILRTLGFRPRYPLPHGTFHAFRALFNGPLPRTPQAQSTPQVRQTRSDGFQPTDRPYLETSVSTRIYSIKTRLLHDSGTQSPEHSRFSPRRW